MSCIDIAVVMCRRYGERSKRYFTMSHQIIDSERHENLHGVVSSLKFYQSGGGQLS